MCGTVGLFIGCSALSYCPKKILQHKPDEAGEESSGMEYRSPFQGWHEKASVRKSPRRILQDGDNGAQFFSPELVPIAQHPLIRQLPSTIFDRILVQHLYRYLDFTAKLEYLVVNRTVLGIAHGSVGVEVPEEMRFDAFKMYCDEAYHSLFSVDLARQVRIKTGIESGLPGDPFFIRRLQAILAGLPSVDRPLAELLFVIISETLISATLAGVPDEAGVDSAVHDTIKDHAADEGRHHAYFASFLKYLWAQLSPQVRQRAAVLVPRLMDTFLRPDLESLRLELGGYGMGRDDVEQVLAEVFSPEVISRHMTATARQTIRYFRSLGALEDQNVVDELHKYGFVAGR
ncbi:diiron oxygenase (plasmid) [Streptomyces sp. NBC_00853]|uniref:diiron oxygenase n=1 Tax=Streptomyces sp. NBC_00853 TaxID=2903681 RepID=UPI002F90BD00|nr:diiron oxygenase [Streptomyces sp. NBC_00853]